MDLRDHGGSASSATRYSIQPHFARAKGATRLAVTAGVATHDTRDYQRRTLRGVLPHVHDVELRRELRLHRLPFDEST